MDYVITKRGVAQQGNNPPVESVSNSNEPLVGTGIRTGLRTLARGAESVTDIPINMAHGIRNALQSVTPDKQDMSEFIPNMSPEQKQQVQELMGSKLPFQQSFKAIEPQPDFARRNITQPLTGKYLEPQSENEQSYDEFVTDLAGFFNPVIGMSNIGVKGALKVAGLSNLVDWGAKSLGAGPGTRAALKLGTTATLLHPYTRAKTMEKASEAFAARDAAIADNPSTAVKGLENSLLGLKDWAFDKATGTKKEVLSFTEAFLNKINAGRTSVKDLITMKEDINQLFKENLEGVTKNRLRGIREAVEKELEQYGKTNPEFYKNYRFSNQIYSAVQASKPLEESLLGSDALKVAKNPYVRAIFGTAGLGSAYKLGSPMMAGAAVGSLIAKDAYEAFRFISTNPTARKEYTKALAAGMKNNIAIMNKHIAKLDDIAQSSMASKEVKDEYIITKRAGGKK